MATEESRVSEISENEFNHTLYHPGKNITANFECFAGFGAMGITVEKMPTKLQVFIPMDKVIDEKQIFSVNGKYAGVIMENITTCNPVFNLGTYSFPNTEKIPKDSGSCFNYMMKTEGALMENEFVKVAPASPITTVIKVTYKKKTVIYKTIDNIFMYEDFREIARLSANLIPPAKRGHSTSGKKSKQSRRPILRMFTE